MREKQGEDTQVHVGSWHQREVSDFSMDNWFTPTKKWDWRKQSGPKSLVGLGCDSECRYCFLWPGRRGEKVGTETQQRGMLKMREMERDMTAS